MSCEASSEASRLCEVVSSLQTNRLTKTTNRLAIDVLKFSREFEFDIFKDFPIGWPKTDALFISFRSLGWLEDLRVSIKLHRNISLSSAKKTNVVCRKATSWSRLIISKWHDEDGLFCGTFWWLMFGNIRQQSFIKSFKISKCKCNVFFWFLSASYGCHHLYSVTYQTWEKQRQVLFLHLDSCLDIDLCLLMCYDFSMRNDRCQCCFCSHLNFVVRSSEKKWNLVRTRRGINLMFIYVES